MKMHVGRWRILYQPCDGRECWLYSTTVVRGKGRAPEIPVPKSVRVELANIYFVVILNYPLKHAVT